MATSAQTLNDWTRAAPQGPAALVALMLLGVAGSTGFAWALSSLVVENGGALAALGLAAALGLRGVAAWGQARVAGRRARRICAAVRDRAVTRVLDRRRGAQETIGVDIAACVDEVEALQGYYARFAPAALEARLVPVAIALAVLLRSPISAAILVATLLPLVAVLALAGGAAGQAAANQLEVLARLSGLFVDRIRALPIILAFDAQDQVADQVAQAADGVAHRTMRVLRVALISSAALEFFAAVAVALTAVYCGFALLGLLPFKPPERLDLAAALYAYLFGGNDEDGTPFIEKTGDWTRRLHVVVPIPRSKYDKKRPYMLQISLPYNYAMPFVAGQTVIALMMRAEGRSKQDVGKILGNLTHSVLEGTTPLAQEHSLVGKMTPELMRPFLHVAMNQNWHGAPVHPSDEPWNKGIPASEKGFRSTAEMWKRLARVAHQTTGLDYHPEDYREVMSYFTSTLQGVASRAGDAASDVRSGRKPDPTDVPVAHAFIGGGKQYDSADRRAYYEARDKAFAAETRFKDLKKAAQIDPSKAELVQDFYEKHQADIRAARLFRSGTGTLSDLTKQMNRIQQNKDMTPTEQETELRALRERQLSTMNRLRERVRAGGE